MKPKQKRLIDEFEKATSEIFMKLFLWKVLSWTVKNSSAKLCHCFENFSHFEKAEVFCFQKNICGVVNIQPG